METSSSSITTSASESEQFLDARKRKPIHDLLHSVQKPYTQKPWRKSYSVAPLPPNPTRVYKVKPIEFKDVVQKLTGAVEFQSTRLQTVAPAPLDLNLGGVVRVLPIESQGNELHQMHGVKFGDVKSNGMGFADLSPSSSALCSFLLSSPATGGSTLML